MQDVAKSPLSSVAERSRSRRGDLGVRFMLMLMPEKSFPDELKSVIGTAKPEESNSGSIQNVICTKESEESYLPTTTC